MKLFNYYLGFQRPLTYNKIYQAKKSNLISILSQILLSQQITMKKSKIDPRTVWRHQRRKSKDYRQHNCQKTKRQTAIYITLHRKLENQRSSNTYPTKTQGRTHVFRKGRQFLFHVWHLLDKKCFSTNFRRW